MKDYFYQRRTIRDYISEKQEAKYHLQTGLRKHWDIPADIKATFPLAAILGKSSLRVVFDIGGNNYRMM